MQLIWALGIMGDASISAQQTNQTTITVNTDFVVTWAQITNLQNRTPIKGLHLGDINIQEDGKRQKITLVKEDQPVSIVILVDGMTCVTEPWYQQSETVIRQLGEDAEIALMAWDSDAVIVQPITKNHRLVIEKFSNRYNFFFALNPGSYGVNPLSGTKILVRPERSFHRPADAIFQAAKYLESEASPERRKIIIAISPPNIETAFRQNHTVKEVETLLEKNLVTVFGLVNGNESSKPVRIFKTLINPKRELKGTFSGRLEHFVDFTGGITLTGSWQECDEMFINLAQMIRSSYTIGYYPENTNFDGRFRRIKLELSKSGKAKAGNVNIVARDGYHAVRRSFQRATETPSKQ